MTTPLHASGSHGFADDLVTTMLERALGMRTGTPVFGISGLQGSGKSTLAAQMADAATRGGLRVAVLSLDDFYLPRAQRAQLAHDVHPLLATRGPPGTHDTALALRALDALRSGTDIALPRFDKLADERLPESQWTRVAGQTNLVVFEGWFLGTPAEGAATLEEPVNALERDEDGDGRWRRWCNDALARDYPALWQRIDHLLFLQPPGFEIVPEWRWQQEQGLTSTDPSRTGMDRTQVERFVQHFERVSRQALRTLPAIADLALGLDTTRRPLFPSSIT